MNLRCFDPEHVGGHRICAYALAILSTTAILAARFAGFTNGQPVATILLIPPIILAAYVGGLGPGLLATAIAALGSIPILIWDGFSAASPFFLLRWFGLIVSGVLVSGLNEHLHRVIRDRGTLEAEFFQAQKMESIGLLAGGVAHDFNNALTIIMGSADLLAELSMGDSKALSAVAEIRHASDRATSLTRQLLAFSRKEVVAPEVTDLNTLVAETTKMLKRLVGEHIELKTTLGADIGRIKVDPGQWTQVLMNLAVNARDAMATGGTLLISTGEIVIDDDGLEREGAPPGRYAVLTVSDNGCGMTPQVKARIFEPFYTTKGAGRGTGLGLSVVYGIVKQSGGYIDVTSKAGEGTSFRLYVPVTTDAAPVASGHDEIVAIAGRETILVVEDEPNLRTIAVRGLCAHGYTVLEAANADEAMRIFDRDGDGIDLVITDVMMPGIDGCQLADQLRARRAGVRIVFTSGYTNDALAGKGLDAPDVFFLQKPYPPATLLKVIRRVLDSASKRANPTPSAA